MKNPEAPKVHGPPAQASRYARIMGAEGALQAAATPDTVRRVAAGAGRRTMAIRSIGLEA
jgi:hypothetical protein